MALSVCHLGRLKTCWSKWESGSLYVVWRIEYHWVKSYFHLQHRASLAQTIARQPFIWNETMEEGRSANRNELLSRDGMNFAQQMALGVCHLGRLKTCWIKWESGSLYVVWRTVAIALELLQYSTHREAEKQFPKEAVRRATVIRSEDGRRHRRSAAPCISRVQDPR